MAEIVSKSLSLPWNNSGSCSGVLGDHSHSHQHGVSVFPVKSAIFSCELGLPSLKLRSMAPKSSNSDFYGRRVLIGRRKGLPNIGNIQSAASNAQMGIGIAKAQRWWEKGLQPNMKEVTGAQDLVDSLLNAGEKLVIVDFFSPGCGGCKALHPKICKLAETNPDVQFLQVNYEDHKSMCYTLNVHVLPFFRLYRGAHGRLCSFSCTNATIKKFKDALGKHSSDRCSLGLPKGLEETELIALSANKDLSFNYTPKEEPFLVSAQEEMLVETAQAPAPSSHAYSEAPLPLPHPLPSSTSLKSTQDSKDKTLVSTGR